jgi:hypothetical protein
VRPLQVVTLQPKIVEKGYSADCSFTLHGVNLSTLPQLMLLKINEGWYKFGY